MSTAPHDDFLASFGFAKEGALDAELTALEALAARLGAVFRYFELLYVVGESARADVEAAGPRIGRIANLRVLVVDEGASVYRRRWIGASEAIGDVVALSAFDEARTIDLAGLALAALRAGRVHRMTRASAAPSPVHGLLNLLSAYKVNGADLRTVALPRASLNKILARPSASVELRFEAKREYERQERGPVKLLSRRTRAPVWQRLELVSEIISASAPRLLRGYALVSLATAILAGLYGVYACVVLLTIPVARGWFTTAIAQAGSVGFIALGFTIFSLAIARAVEQAGGAARDAILDEVGQVIFFDRPDELNVDYGAAPKTPAA